MGENVPHRRRVSTSPLWLENFNNVQMGTIATSSHAEVDEIVLEPNDL